MSDDYKRGRRAGIEAAARRIEKERSGNGMTWDIIVNDFARIVRRLSPGLVEEAAAREIGEALSHLVLPANPEGARGG
jgi:hypothetical protein